MRIQLLSLGHQFHGVTDALDTFCRQMLEGDLTAVAVKVHTVVGGGIAVSGQRVVGAAGIVARTLTGIGSKEHAAGVDHLLGEFLVVGCLDNQVFRSIGVREADGLLLILHEHQRTVLQRFRGNLLTRQEFELTVHLSLYVEDYLFRGGDEQHLRVDAVFCLRQQVGSDELYVGLLVGNHTHFRRSCRHVDSHIVQAHLLFGGHHVLVAGSEDLIHLGHGFCAVGHRADGLNTAGLEDLAHAGDTGSHEDGGIHLSATVRRRTEYNLTTTGNLRRRGEHQYGREEWGSTAGDVEAYFLDGDAFLPAGDARLCLHLPGLELLGLMEYLDVIVGQLDGSLQFSTDQPLRLFHLLF